MSSVLFQELVKSKGSLEQSLTEVSSKLKTSDEQLVATSAELSQRVAQLEEEKKNLVEEKKQQQVSAKLSSFSQVFRY